MLGVLLVPLENLQAGLEQALELSVAGGSDEQCLQRPVDRLVVSNLVGDISLVEGHAIELGKLGAFVSGLRHGAFCLGCCWMLMALLFVGGVMNLAWIAGIALLVLIEKTLPWGGWMGRATGVVLVVWGALTLAMAV